MLPVHRFDTGAREALIATLGTELADRADVSFAYVFGSLLAGDCVRDIDVAIWTTEWADATADIDLAVRFSRAIGLPVDVRRINDAPLSFRFHVFAAGCCWSATSWHCRASSKTRPALTTTSRRCCAVRRATPSPHDARRRHRARALQRNCAVDREIDPHSRHGPREFSRRRACNKTPTGTGRG